MAWARLNLRRNFGARATLKLGCAGQTSEMASAFAFNRCGIELDGSKGRVWGARGLEEGLVNEACGAALRDLRLGNTDSTATGANERTTGWLGGGGEG